jgi:hypothetical protein
MLRLSECIPWPELKRIIWLTYYETRTAKIQWMEWKEILLSESEDISPPIYLYPHSDNKLFMMFWLITDTVVELLEREILLVNKIHAS